MGVVYGEWVFPAGAVPAPEAVVERLGARMGLPIESSHDDAGRLISADVAVLGESLFDWEVWDERIAVCSFIPAHPYLWAQLGAAMSDLGGRVSEAGNAWRSEPDNEIFRRPWGELSRRQRLILRLPTIGTWRPLDFLARRMG